MQWAVQIYGFPISAELQVQLGVFVFIELNIFIVDQRSNRKSLIELNLFFLLVMG